MWLMRLQRPAWTFSFQQRLKATMECGQHAPLETFWQEMGVAMAICSGFRLISGGRWSNAISGWTCSSLQFTRNANANEIQSSCEGWINEGLLGKFAGRHFRFKTRCWHVFIGGIFDIESTVSHTSQPKVSQSSLEAKRAVSDDNNDGEPRKRHKSTTPVAVKEEALSSGLAEEKYGGPPGTLYKNVSEHGKSLD